MQSGGRAAAVAQGGRPPRRCAAGPPPSSRVHGVVTTGPDEADRRGPGPWEAGGVAGRSVGARGPRLGPYAAAALGVAL